MLSNCSRTAYQFRGRNFCFISCFPLRTIKGPFTNPERKPLVDHKPFVTEADYQNSELKVVDPDRHFLIERDMHDRDRNNKNEFDEDTQGGRKIYTGRAYYK